MENLVEIDKKTFYDIIYFFGLDVHPSYQVCSEAHWKTRGQYTFGRTTTEGENWPYAEKYYVTNHWAERSKEIPANFTR